MKKEKKRTKHVCATYIRGGKGGEENVNFIIIGWRGEKKENRGCACSRGHLVDKDRKGER